MKKVICILLPIILLVLIGCIVFFVKNNDKFFNSGNTIGNQSAEEIKEYILNMQSYEAEITVTVKGNKVENNYVLQQKHITGGVSKQEVLEPSNIQGVTLLYDGNSVILQNAKLTLSKVYQSYQPLGENFLFLESFIKDYQEDKNSTLEEKENKVILTTKKQEGKRAIEKKLTFDRNTGRIAEMEIKDGTQNMLVYILYNKIEMNHLQEEEVLAFQIIKEPDQI